MLAGGVTTSGVIDTPSGRCVNDPRLLSAPSPVGLAAPRTSVVGRPREWGNSRQLETSFFELPASFQRVYLPMLEAWFIEEHREEIERLKERLGDSEWR